MVICEGVSHAYRSYLLLLILNSIVGRLRVCILLVIQLLQPFTHLGADEVGHVTVILAGDLNLLEELMQVGFLFGLELLRGLLAVLIDVLIVSHV